MKNNNHNNSDCGFSDELVSYLYGESNAAENALFEKHLNKCSNCAEEFQAFSGVHFSINDWKMKDFANLETPVIEIPYEKSKQPEVSVVKETWLSAVRDLFSLSPRAFSLATASFAVLAICVGIVFLVINSRQNNFVAENDKNKKSTSSPKAEKTPPENNTAKTPQTEQKQPSQDSKQPQSDIVIDTKPKNVQVVKASGKTTQIQKTDNAVQPKKDVKRANKNIQNAPKMIEDDEEDETLRLAEIFDEIGSVEE